MHVMTNKDANDSVATPLYNPKCTPDVKCSSFVTNTTYVDPPHTIFKVSYNVFEEIFPLIFRPTLGPTFISSGIPGQRTNVDLAKYSRNKKKPHN